MATSTPVKSPRAAKPRKSSQRTGVIVAGMHRSGTSALTRVLNLVGCDLPKTLMGANKTNEAGHWESLPICRLDDRILESAGTTWDDWLELNPGWLQSPKADEFREQAQTILADEFGSSRLFVLKDPRICKFVGFWTEIFEAADIRPLIVMPIRNPLEVAASLQKRNGLETAFGLLLWLRYVLDAEFSSRGFSRFFTSYDQVMSGWGQAIEQAQSVLQVNWPRLSNQSMEEIEGFLSDRYRHHRETREAVTANPTLSEWLRSTFDILSNWSQSGERQADHAVLDRIRTEFNAASPAFSRLIASGQTARDKVQKLERNLGEIQTKLFDAESSLTKQQELVKRIDGELIGSREQLSEREKKLSSLQAEIEKRQSDLQAVEKAQSEAGGRLAELEATSRQQVERTRQLERALAEARDAKAKSDQERTKLKADLDKQAIDLQAAEKSRADAEQSVEAVKVLESARSEASKKVEEIENALKQQLERAKKLSEALDGARNGKASVEKERDFLKEEVKKRADELAAVEKMRAEADGTLVEAHEETRRHADKAKELEQALAAAREARAKAEDERNRLKAEVDNQADKAKASEAGRVEALERLGSLEKSLQQQQDEATQLSNALASVRDAKTAAEQDRSRLQSELDKLSAELQTAQEVQTDVLRKLAESESESASARDRAAESESALSTALANKAAMDEKLRELENSRQVLDAESHDNARRLEEELSQAKWHLGERDQAIADLQELLSNRSEALNAAHQMYADVDWRRGELESMLFAGDQRIRELDQAVADAARGRMEAEEIAARLEREANESAVRFEEALKLAAEREDALSLAAAEIQQQAQRADALQSELDAQFTESETARKALAALRDRLAQTESALAQRRLEAEQTSAELSIAQQQLRQMEAVRDESDKVVGGFREHVNLLIGDVRERQAALVELENNNRMLTRQVAETEAKLLQTEVGRIESDKIASGFKEHIELLIGDTRERQAALVELENANRILTRQASDAAANLRRVTEAKAAAEAEKSDFASRVELQLQEISRLRSELERRVAGEADLSALKLYGQETEETLRRATEAKAAAEAEKSDLASQLERQMQEVSRLQAELERRVAAEADLSALTLHSQETEETLRRATEEKTAAEAEKNDFAAQLERQMQEVSRLRTELDLRATAYADVPVLQETNARLAAEVQEFGRFRLQSERQMAEHFAEMQNVRADADKAKGERATLEIQLKESFKEITTLSRLMGEKEREAGSNTASAREAAAKEMGKAVVALLDNGSWPFLPAKMRLRRKMALLKRSGIFDPAWYLSTYKDVQAAGMDPLWHYVEHGAREGREPNSLLAALNSGSFQGKA